MVISPLEFPTSRVTTGTCFSLTVSTYTDTSSGVTETTSPSGKDTLTGRLCCPSVTFFKFSEAIRRPSTLSLTLVREPRIFTITLSGTLKTIILLGRLACCKRTSTLRSTMGFWSDIT